MPRTSVSSRTTSSSGRRATRSSSTSPSSTFCARSTIDRALAVDRPGAHEDPPSASASTPVTVGVAVREQGDEPAVDRRGGPPGELLVADHAGQLGEVRLPATAPPQVRDAVVSERSLQDLVASRQLFGSGDDGVRDAGHARRRLRGRARRASAAFAATNAGVGDESSPRARGNATDASSTTMRPGRADITMTRSARSSASSTSCVTSRTVRPSAVQTSCSHSCIERRVIASSAPERLVEQQHGTGHEERAQQRHSLPHAARERAGHARSNPARPNRSRRAARRRGALARARTPATSAPSVAFASTRRHGISRSCCG